MRYYELTCLGDINLIQENVVSLIQKEGGILVNVYKKANTVTFYFQMEPENLANLEKKIKPDNQISRYILLAKKPQRPDRYVERTYLEEKPRQKVEIKEIEKKLEEILKE